MIGRNDNFITTPIKGESRLENTRISTFTGDLKTIVLWIYNINQNGVNNTAKVSCEDNFPESDI